MNNLNTNGENLKSNVPNNSITSNQGEKKKSIDLATTTVSAFQYSMQTENPKQISVKEYLEAIKSADENRLLFERVGKLIDKSALDEFKRKQIPGITLSVSCNHKRQGGLDDKIISYSKLIQIDLDNIEPTEFDNLRYKIENDPYTVFSFRSISGNGLKVAFIIDPNRHLESFQSIERYFEDNFEFVIDTKVKDLFRLCFVSFDPDIYVNEYATPFILEPINENYNLF